MSITLRLRAAEMRWQQSSTALRKKLFLNWHCSSQVVLYPEKVEVMVYQKMLRSLVGSVPRYIKLQTTSTAAPLMYIGEGRFCCYWNDYLLCFLDIDAEIPAPNLQLLYLLSVITIIIFGAAFHNCCVICKFHNMTDVMFYLAVIRWPPD